MDKYTCLELSFPVFLRSNNNLSKRKLMFGILYTEVQIFQATIEESKSPEESLFLMSLMN